MKLYAIFDRAADRYVERIMVLPSDASAKRIFVEACADQRSEIAKYPTDYELFRVGEFDPGTGIIVPGTEMICRGSTDFGKGAIHG